jgi:P-type Cu2+ transporter
MSSDVIALSRITYQKVMLNLVWATPYNVIAVPAAAGPFALGNCSPDEISALAINLTTVIVTVKRTFYVISL